MERRVEWRNCVGRLGLLVLMVVAAVVVGCDKVGEVVKKARETGGKLEELRAKQQGKTGAGGSHGPAYVGALGEAEFDAFIARPATLVVVDFYADWCGPCRSLGPVLERVCRELGPQVALGKVNVDREGGLASRLRVSSIPDVRLFREGRQVGGFVGAIDESRLRSMLEAELAKVAPDLPASENSDGGKGAAAEPPIQRMKKGWLPPGIERNERKQ